MLAWWFATALAGPVDHCTEAEVAVFFSCRFADGKVVSLCASPDLSPTAGTLQYRFGEPGAVELSFPSEPAHPRGHFTQRTGTWGPRVNEHVISFVNEGVTYSLTDRFEHGEQVNQLAVKLGNGKVYPRQCVDTVHAVTGAPRLDHDVFPDDAVLAALADAERYQGMLDRGCLDEEEPSDAEALIPALREARSAVQIFFATRDYSIVPSCD